MIHPLAAHLIALNGRIRAHACLVEALCVRPCVCVHICAAHLLKCMPVVPTRSHVVCSDK